jgi:hypothetical protein
VDFDAIRVEGTTAYVPLVNQRGEVFSLSGAFYIGLNVEVDSLNIVDVPYREHYIVHFAGGKGIFDIDNPGEQMVIGATLKVINLPENTDTDSFALVSVGGIARCAKTDDILIKPEEREAQIPLVVNDGKEFDKSGTYYIAMRLIVDSLSSVEVTAADYLMVEFTNGYGVLDMVNVYNNMLPGYLNGHLTNEGNYYEPRVASGAMFELLGNYFRVVDDEPIKTTAILQSMMDGIVYVYAVPNEKFVINAGILHYTDSEYADFRYAKNEPVYNAERKGWYNGNNRALWKFLKIGNEYRFKVRVGEDFPFDYAVTNTVTGTLRHSFSGDIYPAEITLEPGFYIFEVAGASGGGGGVLDAATPCTDYEGHYYRNISSSDFTATAGGAGGKIIELINVKKSRKFWAYTGKRGRDGRTYGEGGWGQVDTVGMVAGGGGSGSYISDSVGASKGYFLSAGGGGGGYINFQLAVAYRYSYTYSDSYENVYTGYEDGTGIIIVYVPGGGGGLVGGGGSGGWAGSREANDGGNFLMYEEYGLPDIGFGGGIFGGKTVYSPDAFGEIKKAGYESIVKQTWRYTYSTKNAGAGASLFPVTAANLGGDGGYITESGAAYSPTAGGNNRNSVRGGNSGDGYVNVYKLQ